MNKKPKAPTLRQFQDRFPTEDSCLEHLMRTRFGDRHDCDGCDRNAHFYRVKARRSYACEYCGHQVYPTAGTPFDRTRTPLRDWFFVMFQFCASRNGVAAKEVERQLGVTYKTAWRMCHLIREYMGQVDGNAMIGGEGEIVEIDETLIGGRMPGSGHGNYRANKTVVLGMVERGGELVTAIVPNVKKESLFPVIADTVMPGTIIHTDQLNGYRALPSIGLSYGHASVNHNREEWARDNCHVQTIEGFWSQLKRGINGTHIHVSAKHLSKYLGEFEYRWNMRDQPHLMIDRLMVSFSR